MSTAQKVFDSLRESPGTAGELAQRLGLSARQVGQALGHLRRIGEAWQSDDGSERWHVPTTNTEPQPVASPEPPAAKPEQATFGVYDDGSMYLGYAGEQISLPQSEALRLVEFLGRAGEAIVKGGGDA